MAQINLDDLKPNSKLYKSEQNEEGLKRKKLAPVVSKDNVVQTKTSLSQKFMNTFIQGSAKEVEDYIFDEVLIPGIKNTILDALSMFFFKESYSGGRKGSREDEPSYTQYYKSGRKNRNKSRSRRRDEEYESDDKVDYMNIVLRHKSDADAVVDELRRRIDKYDQASVADLFDLIEVTGKYTDNNWGWTDPRDIGVRRVSNGYLIDVAEAELLD